MNKLTKQTVYLPVKEGESEISVSHWEKDTYITDVKEQQVFVFTPEQLNEYVTNIIKQALETAAAKADLIETDGDVDPKSITNTFEETFQKYKV